MLISMDTDLALAMRTKVVDAATGEAIDGVVAADEAQWFDAIPVRREGDRLIKLGDERVRVTDRPFRFEFEVRE